MRNYNKKIVVTAAVLAAVTIAIGAFGAHALQLYVAPKYIATFETGVRYQMYHVLALLVVGFAVAVPPTIQKWVFRWFLGGILLFSGSIYLLALNDLLVFFDFKRIGFVTPIGGLLFMTGWLHLAYGMFTLKKV